MTQAPVQPSTEPVPNTRPATPSQLDWLGPRCPSGAPPAGSTTGPRQRSSRATTRRRRFDLSRLLLTLGAAFVGIGILWLVASNLDQLSPLTRFLVVAAFWLAFLVGGELLARRREHGGAIPSPVVGAVRVLAALTFGALVMQAAQSLQVPAYTPTLLAWWGLGALIHAYAVRGTGPLVIGLLGLGVWLIWQSAWDEPGALSILLAIFAGGVVAASVAALHADRLPGFAAAWREVGAALSLGALFVAALPFVDTEDFVWTTFLVVALVLAGLAAVAGSRWRPGTSASNP